MKALIDTNILLDVILQREPHLAESKRVLECCISIAVGRCHATVSPTEFIELAHKEIGLE